MYWQSLQWSIFLMDFCLDVVVSVFVTHLLVPVFVLTVEYVSLFAAVV